MSAQAANLNPSGSADSIADIFIVDDHETIRLGLRMLIEHEPGLRVCGEAGSITEAEAILQTVDPDVIVLDLSLPNGEGLQLLRRLRGSGPEPRVVVMTSKPADVFAPIARVAGADAFVPKHEAMETIVLVIRRVLAGEACFPDPPGADRSVI